LQAACTNPLSEPPRADRILVIRLGAMGDVVRTLPSFAELRRRYPDARIAWLVERKSEAVLRRQPGLDEVLVFPREALEACLAERRGIELVRVLRRFVAGLRSHRFDLVLDFHGILKSGLIARLSGARLRIGYASPFAKELSNLFVNRRVAIEPPGVSRFVRNAGLVDFLGVGPETTAAAECGEGEVLAADPERVARMRELLAASAGSGAGGGAIAVIHPGSSEGAAYKRYPVEAWGEVARGLAAEDVRCVVSAGSDAERSLAEAVIAASRGCAALAPETPDFDDLVALYAACQLFLGGDSGPLHVASLVGTPVVQLLGPTDPTENRPWAGAPSRSVRVPMACSPCRRGCSAASCMNVLPAAAVVSAARELLPSRVAVASA
jgi:heptosyltransferase-1